MVTSLPPLLNPLFSKNSSGKVKSGRFQALFNACFRQCPVYYYYFFGGYLGLILLSQKTLDSAFLAMTDFDCLMIGVVE